MCVVVLWASRCKKVRAQDWRRAPLGHGAAAPVQTSEIGAKRVLGCRLQSARDARYYLSTLSWASTPQCRYVPAQVRAELFLSQSQSLCAQLASLLFFGASQLTSIDYWLKWSSQAALSDVDEQVPTVNTYCTNTTGASHDMTDQDWSDLGLSSISLTQISDGLSLPVTHSLTPHKCPHAHDVTASLSTQHVRHASFISYPSIRCLQPLLVGHETILGKISTTSPHGVVHQQTLRTNDNIQATSPPHTRRPLYGTYKTARYN